MLGPAEDESRRRARNRLLAEMVARPGRESPVELFNYLPACLPSAFG